MTLKLNPNIVNPDDLYEFLLAAHEGLSAEDSMRLNFRLILILMNQIGDASVLSEALRLAAPSATLLDNGERP